MLPLKTAAISIFCSFICLYSNAQSISVEDGYIKYDKESRPCLVAHVDPEPKMLEKAWNAYLKENHDFKLGGRKIRSAERVTISALSSNAMDFYTQIIEDRNGSEMKVFARYGYDMYIDKASFSAEYDKLQTMIESFLKTFVTDYYQDIIDDTEKKVNKLSKVQTKLEKQIEKDLAKAEKLEAKAAELKETSEANKTEKESNKEKLEARQEKLKRYKEKLRSVR